MYLRDSQWIQERMRQMELPPDAVQAFLDAEAALAGSGRMPAFKALAAELLTPPYCTDKGFSVYRERLDALAAAANVHPQTLYYVLCLYLAEDLYRRCCAAGQPAQLFDGAMDDLRTKLLENLEESGIPGTSVPHWFYNFVSEEMVSIGRFEYKLARMIDPDITLPCGFTVHKDDRVLGLHIPSHRGSLTDAVRSASYREAWEYFSALWQTDTVVLRCISWLLFPAHYEMLPPQSNIVHFMNDFHIYKTREPAPDDLYSVFGTDADLPVQELPEDTVLQRAYKRRLLSGEPIGRGGGLIVLKDGVNVTNIPGVF